MIMRKNITVWALLGLLVLIAFPQPILANTLEQCIQQNLLAHWIGSYQRNFTKGMGETEPFESGKYLNPLFTQVACEKARPKYNRQAVQHLKKVLIAMAAIEKSFRVDRKASKAGAKGLMQFMPGTGRDYGLITDEDFFNPLKSLRAAAVYYQDLRKQSHITNDRDAFLAYICGPGNVKKLKAKESNECKQESEKHAFLVYHAMLRWGYYQMVMNMELKWFFREFRKQGFWKRTIEVASEVYNGQNRRLPLGLFASALVENINPKKKLTSAQFESLLTSTVAALHGKWRFNEAGQVELDVPALQRVGLGLTFDHYRVWMREHPHLK